jgi:nitrogenase molybdenum-iron protein alpha/beta subunit
VTGALSVTTAVLDGISVIHGPAGCAHHNFSLLHSTYLENDRIRHLNLVSSDLTEQDVIFGGERALESAIGRAVAADPGAVFVLSTCVAGTIGDDIGAVAEKAWDVPVIPIPGAGFLGGTFQDGFVQALSVLSRLGETGSRKYGVNIIGERNLEFEVEEHYREVERLCGALGLPVSLRFVKDQQVSDIARLGSAEVNILRDRTLRPIGDLLRNRFGTPYIESFPEGFDGTLRFLRSLAEATGRNPVRALREEEALQEEILDEFSGLRDAAVSIPAVSGDPGDREAALSVARSLGMNVSPGGTQLPVPVSVPVGSGGVRRLLHRWRRAMHG